LYNDYSFVRLFFKAKSSCS